jgi:hypothetical protein
MHPEYTKKEKKKEKGRKLKQAKFKSNSKNFGGSWNLGGISAKRCLE